MPGKFYLSQILAHHSESNIATRLLWAKSSLGRDGFFTDKRDKYNRSRWMQSTRHPHNQCFLDRMDLKS